MGAEGKVQRSFVLLICLIESPNASYDAEQPTMGKSERHTKDPFTLIKVDEKGSGVAYIIAGLPSLRFLELILSAIGSC